MSTDPSQSETQSQAQSAPTDRSVLGRSMVLGYGVVCYLTFFLTFLYLIGFVGGGIVPKHVNSGTLGPTPRNGVNMLCSRLDCHIT